jgi:hypothetical protein
MLTRKYKIYLDYECVNFTTITITEDDLWEYVATGKANLNGLFNNNKFHGIELEDEWIGGV